MFAQTWQDRLVQAIPEWSKLPQLMRDLVLLGMAEHKLVQAIENFQEVCIDNEVKLFTGDDFKRLDRIKTEAIRLRKEQDKK